MLSVIQSCEAEEEKSESSMGMVSAGVPQVICQKLGRGGAGRQLSVWVALSEAAHA